MASRQSNRRRRRLQQASNRGAGGVRTFLLLLLLLLRFVDFSVHTKRRRVLHKRAGELSAHFQEKSVVVDCHLSPRRASPLLCSVGPCAVGRTFLLLHAFYADEPTV